MNKLFNYIIFCALLLPSYSGIALAYNPLLDIPQKQVSPLQIMDALHERMTWVEKELTYLEQFGQWLFPDLKIKSWSCGLEIYNFRYADAQMEYRKYLEERLSCLRYILGVISSRLDKPEEAVPDRKSALPDIRTRVSEFEQVLKQIEYQLSRAFYHNYYTHNGAPRNDLERGQGLLLLPAVLTHNFDVIVRGRVTHISKEWRDYLSFRGKLVPFISSPDFGLKNPARIYWNGPAFEMRIPSEDITQDRYEFLWTEGKMVNKPLVLSKYPITVTFCKPGPFTPFFSECLSSNKNFVYFLVLEATMSIELSASN